MVVLACIGIHLRCGLGAGSVRHTPAGAANPQPIGGGEVTLVKLVHIVKDFFAIYLRQT
jgi:hypothetical protein